MSPGKWFAFAQIALSIMAALGYAFTTDWRLSMYFVSAAVLNICVVTA